MRWGKRLLWSFVIVVIAFLLPWIWVLITG